MMRTDINIAMIAMARLPRPSLYAANASSTPMYCYNPANVTDELDADNVTKVVCCNILSLYEVMKLFDNSFQYYIFLL